MTEAERLHQIYAYLDLIVMHIFFLPEKTDPDEYARIVDRLSDLRTLAEQNRQYSIERRQDAAEAHERVSAMIGTVN